MKIYKYVTRKIGTKLQLKSQTELIVKLQLKLRDGLKVQLQLKIQLGIQQKYH